MEEEEYEEEEEVEEDEEKEKEMVSNRHPNSNIKTDTRLGLCSVCHLSITERTTDETNVAFERASFSSQGHLLLCRRCIEHFSFQSGQRHVNADNFDFNLSHLFLLIISRP